ncbi:MAG: zinc dependent phospholipase C family protein [Ignavibacteriae bacterium]|nr:zinc dependent phospholipase C family protein [Ignavibacteriota bacterium]
MAGAFTHMALVVQAIDSMHAGELKDTLNAHNNWVTAGSVGPDMPYLSYLNLLKLGKIETNWADIMHYQNTGGIVNLGLRTLSITKGKKNWEQQVAWLCGFSSHLIADATVHPVVELIAGPCQDATSMDVHHECENYQDTFIMKDVIGIDITKAEYTNFLRSCKADTALPAVMNFWAEHARVACPVFGKPDPASWFDSYTDLLDTADAGNLIWKHFRHAYNFMYKSPAELRRDEASKCKRYYDDVPLPGGKRGAFKADVFDRAVDNIVRYWATFESPLFHYSGHLTPIAGLLPEWNLDNGVDPRNAQQSCWG